MEQRIYDSRISDLENKISYGTLGPIERLVLQANDPPHLKKNILIVNGNTIIRNCYNKDLSVNAIMQQTIADFDKLFYFFDYYAQGGSYIFVYFHPEIYSTIPEIIRRKVTPSREMIGKVAMQLAIVNSFKYNHFMSSDHSGSSKLFINCIKNAFAYKTILADIRQITKSPSIKAWLITHCPIDYFMLPGSQIDLISSHTGSIIDRTKLGLKVFGEDIPFNHVTYKLFGDKEFIRPLCRNKPKTLELLKGTNLKLRTEREIYNLALNKLQIDKKLLETNL